MPHRCVFGCSRTDIVMHVFPNPEKNPERFQAWVNLAGGKLETSTDYDFYKKKRVCDIHFTEEHRNRFKRLNALAIPSLCLPGSVQIVPQHSGPIISNIQPLVTPVLTNLPLEYSDGCHHISQALHDHNYSCRSRKRPKRVAVNNTQSWLHIKIRNLRSEVCRLRKKGMSFKKRLHTAQKLSENVAFQLATEQMSKPAQLFAHMQLQNKKKAKGRRFSIDEKILALSLFKKSPKCYKLLCKYFTLPSSRAMKRLLSQIKLTPGINPIIFEKIKKSLNGKDKSERLCSLIFDEMSITPHVAYDIYKDQIKGFATNRPTEFADHVLTFMVKGTKHNFKQPVAYYFTHKLNSIELKILIKAVIQHIMDAGLIVVCTVCDQSAVNVSAIKDLVNDTKATYLRKGKEWRYDMIRIKGHNIIPLYDTPHLIKCIRNNLITKDMIYSINNEQKIVKWEYFQRVYAADKSFGQLRLLNKLTEEHVNPEKIKKMRVKSATQLFSHSVAVVTEHLTARGDLPNDCRQIIDIVLLLDNLFDSLNGNTFSIPNGKVYKGPVKRNTPHHQLWLRAKEILKTIKFIKKVQDGNKCRFIETTPPTIFNFIKSIEGMEHLWKLLNLKYGYDAMLTRNFNQDPIENFFGNIRSYGVRNIAPNTVGFEGAFKALLINNKNINIHSNRANCEEDSNEYLQSLNFFLTEKIEVPDVPEETEFNINQEICFDQSVITDAGQSNYVCGWILKKCLKTVIKGCQHCRAILLEKNTNPKNSYIRAKEYCGKKWLCYPSEEIEKYFKAIQKLATDFLKRNVPKNKLKDKIKMFIDILIDTPPLCPTHIDSFKKFFIDSTLNTLITSWCTSINRILDGKMGFDGEDETKMTALKYYNQHKNYKNRK